jgi:serine protease AprX
MHRLARQFTLAVSALALCAGSARADKVPPAQQADLLRHVSPAHIQADIDGDTVFENLAAKLAVTPPDQALPVIVRYKRGHEAASARIARRISHQLGRDRSVAARLTRPEIEALLASGVVESVEEDALCYATRDTADASFGTAKARADFGLTGNADGDPNRYTARDLTIAVIDSGIDPRHPDCADGKIIAWKDFVNGAAAPYDDNGHGTHCASIAAGRLVNGVSGVAPGASLISLKVLNAQGSGSLSTIASAVDWCIQNKSQFGIEVVSMSLGSATSSDGTDVLSRTVNQAVAAGLVVCVAAGNAGPNPYTVGAPGAAERCITLGNMLDTGKGGFVINASSSRGPTADGRIKPDLCAPGTQILAAKANTNGYVRMTGTSMACPFAAGVAALMLQADPSLAPDDVKRILKETAVHFGSPGENHEFGAGRLDGYAALAAATRTEGTAPVVPDHLFAQGQLTAAGTQHTWTVPVDDTRFALALSLIMVSAGTDFELYVYDPAGKLVARSEGATRQETLIVRPETTGTYSVVVYDYSGSGGYVLDFSAGSSLK